MRLRANGHDDAFKASLETEEVLEEELAEGEASLASLHFGEEAQNNTGELSWGNAAQAAAAMDHVNQLVNQFAPQRPQEGGARDQGGNK